MPLSKHSLADHTDTPTSFYGEALFPGMPEPHFAAIGRFMATCARHESSLHRAARFLMNASDAEARVIIGQPRIPQLTQLIIELCTLKGWDKLELDQLKQLRDDIAYIYGVRNIVAHRMVTWRGDWLRFDKYHSAAKVVDPKKLLYVTNVEELNNLSEMVHLIIGCLSQILIPENPIRDLNAANIANLEAFKADKCLPPEPRM